MSLHIVALAGLMWLVTYPSRALPLLVPGIERLPSWLRSYLQLIGPAVLGTLAAVTALVVSRGGDRSIEPGVVAVGTVVCVAVFAARKNLLLGLTIATVLTALIRAIG